MTDELKCSYCDAIIEEILNNGGMEYCDGRCKDHDMERTYDEILSLSYDRI